MESIREEFECEICLNCMVPPIRLCREGHSFCDRCDKFLEQCPICRSPKWEICNIAMETMFTNLLIPCAANECKTIVQGKNWGQHRLDCSYINNSGCLLREIENCSWKGSKEDVMEHCLQSHKSNAFKCSKATFLYQSFRYDAFVGQHNRETPGYHILMQCYGEIFKCVWDVDTCTGLMRCVVYRVNPQSDTEYKFYVVFIFLDYSSLIISSDCKVQQINESIENFLIISVHDELCNLIGMYYTVSICKSYEPSSYQEDFAVGPIAIPKASPALNPCGINTDQ